MLLQLILLFQCQFCGHFSIFRRQILVCWCWIEWLANVLICWVAFHRWSPSLRRYSFTTKAHNCNFIGNGFNFCLAASGLLPRLAEPQLAAGDVISYGVQWALRKARCTRFGPPRRSTFFDISQVNLGLLMLESKRLGDDSFEVVDILFINDRVFVDIFQNKSS